MNIEEALEKIQKSYEQQNIILRNILASANFMELGQEHILTFPHKDKYVSMYLPQGSYDKIQRHICLYRSFYELKLLEDLCPLLPLNDFTVIDCGANIGNHSLFYGLFTAANRVIAIEAMRPTFEILHKNSLLNPDARIETHHAIVGTGVENVKLSRYVSSNVGATQFKPELTGINALPTISIDSLQAENVKLIKIDVEGMQKSVISGAKNTIASCRPLIFMEINSGEEECLSLLNFFGYLPAQKLNKENYLFVHKDGTK